VDNIGEIARCRASAERVLSLDEDIRLLDTSAHASGRPRICLEPSGDPRLVIEDLCITEPSGHILLENFSADIRSGERVLITGDPAVTGRFFKVIGGLWPWGSGRVKLPGDGEVLFIAQRPFLPEGTLREAVNYPLPPDAFPDPSIRQAFECAGIAWLAPRMDETDNWEQALPLRARQRLGFARILLHRPAWVFMEEATDAFDPKGERLILEMLCRELPNTTLLNISFHPGLRQLHHRTLILSREGETKILFGRQRGNSCIH
jgi:putative ATP-binding cassette transporter